MLLSQRVFVLSTARVPEYLFSISDSSETILSMEKSTSICGSGLCAACFSNQLSKCVTYLSRTFIKYSSAILPSDTSPEEITSSGFFKNASPVLKIARKGSLKRSNFLVFFITEEANDLEEKRKKQRENKIKEQRNLKFKQLQILQV